MMRVGLIGPGRVGQALVRLLPAAKYEVGPVLSRTFTSARRAVRLMKLGTPVRSAEEFADCRLILIAVPDDAIAEVAVRLGQAAFQFRGKAVFHTSGALDSSLLEPVRARGAAAASLHPLQTFGRHVLSLSGVYFAVEGDERALRWAQTLVTDWRAKLLRLNVDQKVLYHAAATFASPLFTPLLQAAVTLLGHAGIGRKTAVQALRPLILTTLANFTQAGGKSWTGPLARGDGGTIAQHLEALQDADPVLAEYYRNSARSALRLLARHSPLRRWLDGLTAGQS